MPPNCIIGDSTVRIEDLQYGTKIVPYCVAIRGFFVPSAGQMTIVSGVASQVEISYHGPTGRIKTRRKQPASLIGMEEGIEVIVGDEGCPLIWRCPGGEDESSEEGLHAVSSEDESRTQ